MAKQLVDDLLAAIRQKENQLLEREADHQQDKKRFEQAQLDLYNRQGELIKLLERQEEKMKRLLTHYDAKPDEAAEFYQTIQGLYDESDWAYRNAHQALEEEIDTAERSFYQEREQLEKELHQLRRDYNASDD